MTVQPRQRPDGRCALPGCRQPLPPVAVQHGDPFCSSDHARAFHGCPVPAESIWRGLHKRSKAAA